jgi:quercetin dioxygenase-like cupin family protein
MSTKHILTLIFTFATCAVSHGQHDHQPNTTEPPLQFKGVLTQVLSDPELKDYRLESSIMTIIPSGVDTVSHRHDCELFGYVLSGDVEIALVNKTAKSFHAGDMFYEKRNVLHTITRNPDKDTPTKILLMFIIKNGRAGYTRAYDNK